ncbi:MAG TPA: hypothetical protein VN944_08810 [Nitrospiria bacterium]|nr:hypothetical protein [Nitrospiria bacterium]
MNPTVSTMAAGDLPTRWRRFAALTIVWEIDAVANLLMLIDPRPLLARCRLSRRVRIPAARVK